jgi:hypothetical protein
MSDVLLAPRLMTLKEAAAFLRMSMSSLYQNKQIPRYRLPGTRRWLYDKDELLAYIKGYSQASASELSTGRPYANPELFLAVSKRPAYRRDPKYKY